MSDADRRNAQYWVACPLCGASRGVACSEPIEVCHVARVMAWRQSQYRALRALQAHLLNTPGAWLLPHAQFDALVAVMRYAQRAADKLATPDVPGTPKTKEPH